MTSTDPDHHGDDHANDDALLDEPLADDELLHKRARTKNEKRATRLVMLAGCTVWGICMYWTNWTWFDAKVASLLGPPTPELRRPIGSVAAVHYIGNLGVNTQVDTAIQSLLLQGIVNVERGAMLETRTGPGQALVCVTGSEQCWYWMGHR